MEDMQEILEDFLVEAFELVEQIDHDLVELETNPEDLELLNRIFRVAHTVKGSSSFLNFDVLTKLTHHMEDVLNKARHGELKITPDIMDVVLESIDRMKTLLNSIRDNGNDTAIGMDIEPICARLTAISEGESPNGVENETPVEAPQKEEPAPTPEPEVDVNQLSDSEVEAEIERLLKARKAEDQARRAQKKQNTAASTTSKPAASTPKAENMEKKVPASGGGGGGGGGMDQTIRVEVKRLDHLMNLIGELVLGKNRLLKIYDDVEERYEGEKFLEELNQVVSQLSIITTDVQLAVMKTRMQPIAKVFNKFPRVVRDLSRELGKQIELEITGEETELDKSIVEEIGDPIMHMIRNSCDHGVEDPATRAANGKPEKGIVQLKAYNEGNHIVVEITDDGKGLDANSLKAKAIEKNLITEREADQMTDKEAFALIFKPGFSTAAKVTNVSGRGVGMDVVKTNIEKLNGVIEIDSELGKGSSFKLKIPLTLAIIQSLLVGTQEEFYAIPLASVLETVRVPIDDIYTIEGKNVLRLRDEVLSLVRLSDVFGVKQVLESGDQTYVVVIGVAESKLGIIVDTLVGQEEIVIKSMGDYLQNIQGIAGATIRGDGRVTLIIDVGAMMDMAKEIKVDIKAQIESSAKKPKEKPSDYKVLIVDDSKMDRTLMQKALEPLGVSLIEATNGVEALNIIKSGDHDIDAILIDIEMPRMDGYTLAGEIRKYSKYRNLPLIAVTSRTSKTDRLRGVEVGMTEYITKPYSPEYLENVVRKNLKLG
ncbi:hybrid sensor histidine kinase/response regulator [Campylobacter coli]|uniref:hybrid sensor histidine kinase/response regulator n=3 Tax=Campylobacter coli TaxID=195 RepID=UPI00092F2D81|nr:chemotaxis protein CheW [Campylobacter coli]EAH5961532.1 hybrid sensor histidine kinase/response regulator [Campylobacter coli]EAH7283706.1 hybrid sensor histidine kinase/response regulator [Campylobacter coli]EAH9557085.1 hybrid sensor histidine kinase/response regulator [Campylobacter coli]EAH9685876.1 hybrid sensor histidine kinase/response regulator [Campylobacter coli]EAI0830221.1 hybrid sensor histidine kinase/response regulator [Campylobacter coli]